ncbi:hypothetical protein [Pantoea ananatis]
MKDEFYNEIMTAMANHLGDGFHFPSHEQIIQELKSSDDPVMMIVNAFNDIELPTE